MIGFEMAYIPSGTYYVSSARQVIAEEQRMTLTEMVKTQPIYAQAKVEELYLPTDENNASEEPISILFPFDSYIPYNVNATKNKLTRFKGQTVTISGYASVEGTSKYNRRLSKKRADRVAKIAKAIGVKVKKIRAVGKDECHAKTHSQYPKCRKVEVIQSNNKEVTQ